MLFFFFNDTATTEIYTLSLHDALPICANSARRRGVATMGADRAGGRLRARWSGALPELGADARDPGAAGRSEEHTSELQSRQYLVCRLLLEKKKNWYHEISVVMYDGIT